MKIKMFEIRDRMTFIPVVCVSLEQNGEAINNSWLLSKAGFRDSRMVLMYSFTKGEGSHDPFSWGDRTYKHAHIYIEKNWDELESSDVIDVEFILGESKVKKKSERLR